MNETTDLVDLLHALAGRGAWDRDAACSLADATRLNPVTGEPTDHELVERRAAAEELCAHCPVRALCGAEVDLRKAMEGQ